MGDALLKASPEILKIEKFCFQSLALPTRSVVAVHTALPCTRCSKCGLPPNDDFDF